jgi:hypothetical protein
MRIHNVNGRKTAVLSSLETVRIRSISVASIQVQNLKLEGASLEDIQAAEDYLRETREHFDQLVKNNSSNSRNRSTR